MRLIDLLKKSKKLRRCAGKIVENEKKIKLEEIEENMNINWWKNYGSFVEVYNSEISRRNDLTFEFVEKHYEKKWEYWYLSYNLNMTAEQVINNKHIPFEPKYLCSNKSFTIYDLIKIFRSVNYKEIKYEWLICNPNADWETIIDVEKIIGEKINWENGLTSLIIGNKLSKKLLSDENNMKKYLPNNVQYDPIKYDPIKYDPIKYDPIKYDPIKYDPIKEDEENEVRQYLENKIKYDEEIIEKGIKESINEITDQGIKNINEMIEITRIKLEKWKKMTKNLSMTEIICGKTTAESVVYGIIIDEQTIKENQECMINYKEMGKNKKISWKYWIDLINKNLEIVLNLDMKEITKHEDLNWNDVKNNINKSWDWTKIFSHKNMKIDEIIEANNILKNKNKKKYKKIMKSISNGITKNENITIYDIIDEKNDLPWETLFIMNRFE
jgi:hypothetical protein